MIRPPESPYLAANIELHRRKWSIAPPFDRPDRWTALPWDSIHGHNPIENAVAWVEGAAGDRPLPETVCVIGAGLGYAVDVIAERSSSKVLVLEPEPAVVPWFFARRDWRDLLTAGRLLVLAGPTFEGAQNAWRLFGDGDANPLIMAHPVLGRLHPEATRAAAQVIGRARQGARGNEEARRKFAVPYLVNTLHNVSRIVRGRSVATLFDRYRGVPVVVAAAGPSLNRNIEELRPQRDRVVLVAVDTALKPLLAAGLPPDFVVALDPGDANARHLTDVVVPESTALVAEPSIAPGSFAAFQGRVYSFRVAEHAPWPWLRSVGIDCGMLRAWGSVVTSTFDLAVRMGGDPVVCIGTDLAYTNGQPYARGTTYEEDWRLTAGPDRPIEWVWEQVVAKRGVPATGVDGAEVQTAKGLMVFRDWLVEASCRPGMPRVINATGAGILHGGRFEQVLLTDLRLPPASPSHPRTVGPAPSDPPSLATGPSHPRTVAPSDRFDEHLLLVSLNPQEPLSVAPSGAVQPYRTRPRRRRIAETKALRVSRGTDVERWSDRANYDRAWESAPAHAARFVPAGSRVLDLGAGLEALARYVPSDCTYTPSDVVALSLATVVADLNKGEFPPGEYDLVTMLGVIEFVHDVARLVRTALARAPLAIVTYCARTSDDLDARLERGFVNDFSRDEFVLLCQKQGWQPVYAERLTIGPGFDQWLFALRGQRVGSAG